MAIKICNSANFYACEQWPNTLRVSEQSAQESMWTMRVMCNEMCPSGFKITGVYGRSSQLFFTFVLDERVW